MGWAVEAALTTARDSDAQVALIRESYEMALITMEEVDEGELHVMFGIGLLVGSAPWGTRVTESSVRALYPGMDLGATLSSLEDKRLIRRTDGLVWFACW